MALGIGILAGPVWALDCERPATAFVAEVCADAGLMAAYGGVESALSSALAEAPDEMARAAILESQAQWESALWSWDVAGTRDMLGADGLHADIAGFAADRAKQLAGINAVISDERAFRERNPGGGFSSSDTGCVLIGAADGVFPYSTLFCGGYVRIQSGARLCSFDMYWASGRIYAFMKIDEVQRVGLAHRGYCVLGNGIGPVCPGANDVPGEPDHWDTSPPQMTFDWDYPRATPAPATGLSPDFWRDADGYYGMAAQLDICLSARVYPPLDLSWPGAGPRPE